MKKKKQNQIEEILNASDIKSLRKVLNIGKRDDQFKAVLAYLERTIYNNDDIELIYKLIELLEEEIQRTSNYLKKLNKIVAFRKKYYNFYQMLHKKSNRNHENKSILILLKEFDRLLNQIVKDESVCDESFTSFELLKFLDVALRKNDFCNEDIVNKILQILERESLNEIRKTYIKSKKIEEIKKIVNDSLEDLKKDYQKEKANINHLRCVYQALCRIENNFQNNIEGDINSRNSDDNFIYLLINLEMLLDNLSLRNISVLYKIIKLLEKEMSDYSTITNKYKLEKIKQVKEKAINKIKSIEKSKRGSSQECFSLREIANRLENIELNLRYDVKEEDIIADYNIVKYIVFELENIDYTRNLINKNPYLIYAYNDNNSNNILLELVEKLLGEIDKKDVAYKKICYYNSVIDLLLKSENLDKNNVKSDILMERCFDRIEENYQSDCDDKFKKSWYGYLRAKFSEMDGIDSIKALNNMYNIHVPIYERPDICEDYEFIDDDFIVTVDEDKDSNKDDAISLKKLDGNLYNLKVYISDPLSLYSMDSSPMKGAFKQATSIYNDNNSIEMFNNNIIGEYLSLDEVKRRNVKVYDFILSEYGELVNFEIQKGSVVVSRNYSYDEFNGALKSANNCYEEELIGNLYDLRKMLFDKNNVLFDSLNVSASSAEKIVAELMIYTNNKVAEYFASNGYPFVYRHYESNGQDYKDVISDIPVSKQGIYIKYLDELGKGVSNAIYSVKDKNHEALGLGYYSHVTSPNRRCADILANQCINNFYFRNSTDEDVKTFESYLIGEVERLNDRLIGIDNYCREVNRHNLVRK